METTSKKFTTASEYFATLPAHSKKMLKELRKTIKEAAPGAEETISYNMPTFKFHGILVYYAAFRDHISLFPTASGINAFKKELASYTTSRGTLQIPFGEAIPYKLITKIVQYRVKENLEKSVRKK